MFNKRNVYDTNVSIMEIFELRYFLETAKHQNIHRASEALRVSPGSLSKAITRLENELAVKLFKREGRNIRLSEQGRLLQHRAAAIVRLEEDARLDIGGHEGTARAVITGPEILLAKTGVDLSRSILKRYPRFTFELQTANDEDAIEQVLRGEAHLAVTTTDQRLDANLATKVIEETVFQTYVGVGHPLYPLAKAKKTVSITEVLKHPFVTPNQALLGKIGAKQSLDGWRDDKFPRKVGYFTSSLRTLEALVANGKALAYLPNYFGENGDRLPLLISDCPFTCTQKIRLIAKNPKEISWLNTLF